MSFPDAVLRDVGARTLDPVVAPRLRDQTDLRPTAYVGNSLLVAGLPAAARLGSSRTSRPSSSTLAPSSRAAGWWSPSATSRPSGSSGPSTCPPSRRWPSASGSPGSLEPLEETGAQLDAFDALQRLRSLRNDSSARASLNHVVGAGSQVRGTAIGGQAAGGVGFWGGHGGGVGFWGGHGGGVGFWGGHGGPSEYAAPGFGGRMPVAWPGIDPWTIAAK